MGRVNAATNDARVLAAAAALIEFFALCVIQAPEPLRKRRLYAPLNLLEFA